jgi:hypothetical protein
MVYKYFQSNNYEDYSSGRVIYHKSKYPNYPVRLAGEIFYRCLEHSNKKDKIIIYDPCCGSSYMITVLGLLCNQVIDTIYCSDISNEAIDLSNKNLSLLTFSGIEKRKIELMDLIKKYNKDSHINALNSLEKIVKQIKHEIKINVFLANILDKKQMVSNKFNADIVITDIPYGNLVNWINNKGNELEELLNGIIPIINRNKVIAISYNKKQKINNTKYSIIENIQIGHRKIKIMKLK